MFFSKANRVGGDHIYKEQDQMLVQMFWYIVLKMSQSIIKLFHYIHFLTTIPCLSPNPPPRPRPCLSCASTAASASRSRWTTPMWPLKAAKCSGVEPHKPRPKAKPQTGEKSEKCWVPQKSKFGKLWSPRSPKLPVNLRNIGVLRCLEVIQLAETHVAVGILWHSIENISAMLPAKMTSINYKSNILQI